MDYAFYLILVGLVVLAAGLAGKKYLNRQVREIEDYQKLVDALDQYRLINFEQVQGVWLVYDTIKGGFLGQSTALEGIIGIAQVQWPDKIVLGINTSTQESYLVSSPPGWARDDEQPLPVDK